MRMCVVNTRSTEKSLWQPGILFFVNMVFALALALCASTGLADPDRQAKTPIVVMLSLDGFRHDYLERYPQQSKNLQRVADSGLQVSGLIPGFPSSTFSNHYSIVTGLYPGNHGIVGNSFFDRSRNALYRLGDRSTVEDGSWYGGEPLWVAAEKAGLRSASFFWVGSEADIQGVRPSYYKIYDGSVPNGARVNQVLDWLALPWGQRPNLVTLYFSLVDSAGHRYGPDSKEVGQAIASADKQVGRLMAGLADIDHPVYLLISSDHGMQRVDAEQTIFLDEFIELDDWRGNHRIVPGGSYAFFYSADQSLVQRTQQALASVAGLEVIDPGSFGSLLNFPQDGTRIPNLVVVADAPGYIGFKRGQDREPPQGAHGYLPQITKTMNGIFFASGPGIPAQTRLPDIENVHIYPLVLSLLDIENAAPIDGEPSVLVPYLVD